MFLKAAPGQNVGTFLMTRLRHYVEGHKQSAFALSAATNDVREVGRPAEDGHRAIRAKHIHIVHRFGQGKRTLRERLSSRTERFAKSIAFATRSSKLSSSFFCRFVLLPM
jgi:hypothetical protein